MPDWAVALAGAGVGAAIGFLGSLGVYLLQRHHRQSDRHEEALRRADLLALHEEALVKLCKTAIALSVDDVKVKDITERQIRETWKLAFAEFMLAWSGNSNFVLLHAREPKVTQPLFHVYANLGHFDSSLRRDMDYFRFQVGDQISELEATVSDLRERLRSMLSAGVSGWTGIKQWIRDGALSRGRGQGS